MNLSEDMSEEVIDRLEKLEELISELHKRLESFDIIVEKFYTKPIVVLYVNVKHIPQADVASFCDKVRKSLVRDDVITYLVPVYETENKIQVFR